MKLQEHTKRGTTLGAEEDARIVGTDSILLRGLYRRERMRTLSNLSQAVKQSIHGDEYYSPQNVVDMIVPYINRGGVQSNMVSV